TIVSVERQGDRITQIGTLQGNQPLPADTGEKFRYTPGRRIEKGDLLGTRLTDTTVTIGKRTEQVWVWDDEHTTLVGARRRCVRRCRCSSVAIRWRRWRARRARWVAPPGNASPYSTPTSRSGNSRPTPPCGGPSPICSARFRPTPAPRPPPPSPCSARYWAP